MEFILVKGGPGSFPLGPTLFYAQRLCVWEMIDTIQRMCGDILENVRLLRTSDDITWEVYQRDPRARRFVERTLHILVEACIDLAHHIIAEEGFEEPASYSEAFRILGRHGVLPQAEAESYKRMARFRNLPSTAL